MIRAVSGARAEAIDAIKALGAASGRAFANLPHDVEIIAAGTDPEDVAFHLGLVMGRLHRYEKELAEVRERLYDAANLFMEGEK